jgi:hypothetical protein
VAANAVQEQQGGVFGVCVTRGQGKCGARQAIAKPVLCMHSRFVSQKRFWCTATACDGNIVLLAAACTSNDRGNDRGFSLHLQACSVAWSGTAAAVPSGSCVTDGVSCFVCRSC